MKQSTSEGRRARAFTYPEMIFLLFVLALFLGGTVWVVNGAIVTSHPFRKSEGAGKKGELAMQKIASMVPAGRAFYYSKASVRPSDSALTTGELDFLADLDSDNSTGSYAAGEVRGLERIRVMHLGTDLVVSVYQGPRARPQSLVIIKDLARADVGAFVVRYSIKAKKDPSKPSEMSFTTDSVRVSIATGRGGSRLVVARNMAIPGGAPLLPVP
jgi:hypothetical protein